MSSSAPSTSSETGGGQSAPQPVYQPVEQWSGLWVTLLLLFVYLLSYSGVPHAVDELSALSAAETISISGGWPVNHWHVNQMEWDQSRTPPQNIAGIDGNLYSKKGIGASLIALPLLWVGKHWPGAGAVQLAFLTGALVTALAAYCFYRLTLYLDYAPKTAFWGAIALGLGTLLWPYARTLFGESLGALGLSMALAGAVAFRRGVVRRGYVPLLVAGIGLAILTLAKSSNAVVAPFFAIYLIYARLWEGRKNLVLGELILQALCVAIPVAIGVAITVGYNYARFRTVWTFPLEPFESFSTPLRLGLAGLLVSPGKGLLWYVPLLWLALLGLPKWTHRRRLPDYLLASASLLAPIVLYALWYDWPGGRAWGPRMIVVTMPAIAMLALPALDGLVEGTASRWARWATGLLLGVSVAVQLPAVLVNFELREAADMQAGVTFEQLLWSVDHSPLITYWQSVIQGPHDVWWLQPFLRSLAIWQWTAILTLGGLIVALLWFSARATTAGRRAGLTAGLVLALALFGLTIVLSSADDPRWHERTADHADNLAIFALLDDTAGPGDLALLDMLPGYDSEGRQWLWMNSGPADLAYLGWLRKPAMDDAASARLGAWLEPYNRIWLTLQETDDGDTGSTTERWLDQWGYRGGQTWIGSQRVVEYVIAASDSPWVSEPNSFDGALTLDAYRVAQGETAGSYAVDLDWAQAAPPDLRFSLQALDAAGQLVAQVDRAPGGLDDFTDRVGLSTASPVEQIILKVYGADDSHVLPVLTGDGHVSDYLILARSE